MPARLGAFCSQCGAVLHADPPVTCPSCGARHWRNPKPCAGALATLNGKLLLIRRAHEPWFGCWDIPGGFCDGDEHPESAAVREVKEETGLDVRLTGLLGRWMDSYDSAAETTLNIYYHAELTGAADIRIDPHEVAEIGWFLSDALPKNIAFQGHIPAVLRAWQAAFATREMDP